MTVDVYGSYALVARLVQRSRVKLQSDDGEYDDGEQHQQADLEQRCHGLDDGLQHDLQTYAEIKEKKNTGGLQPGTRTEIRSVRPTDANDDAKLF